MTLLLVCIFFAGWETFWRVRGYGPGFEENKVHWAIQRERVSGTSPEQTVVIGSSRILFGFDLDMWRQAIGGPRPIHLAIEGSGPVPVLHDLAADLSFTGTVLCGVSEGLFFLPPPAPPVQKAAGFVNLHGAVSPSTRAGFYLSVPFETGFAFLNRADLSLSSLIDRWLPLNNRASPAILPPYPPYFGANQYDWRVKMWERTEVDPDLQQKIQQIWMPWFTMGPPLGGPPMEELLQSVAADVAAINERGGRVIFVRYPSTGDLREVERERWPRQAYWDRLLEVTGAPGIHFEDHEELMAFDCPEWSHLTRSDAVSFTRRLSKLVAPILD
jgi:hypothetical protein